MKPDTNRNQIIKKYSETTEKLFMTFEEVEILSVELARRMKQTYPKIDCVAGIANGGLMIASIIAQELKLPERTLDIRRRGSFIKHKLYKFKSVSAFFMKLYRIPVIRVPLYWLNQSIAQPVAGKSQSLEGHKFIGIVDDAVESGRTLVAAQDQIIEQCGAKTITAVLSWSANYGESAAKPDVFIGRRIQHYPWSGNNPQYEEHLQWLEDYKTKQIG